MKNVVIGAVLFLAGSIIFSACMLYGAFEGCVPSEVRGENLLSIVMLILGAFLMGYELLRSKKDN